MKWSRLSRRIQRSWQAFRGCSNQRLQRFLHPRWARCMFATCIDGARSLQRYGHDAARKHQLNTARVRKTTGEIQQTGKSSTASKCVTKVLLLLVSKIADRGCGVSRLPKRCTTPLPSKTMHACCLFPKTQLVINGRSGTRRP